MVSGWACRARVLPDGRRQILNFVLPGDCAALSNDDEPRMFRTFTLTRTATIDGSRLMQILAEGDPAHDGLRTAIAKADRAEIGMMADHIVRLGALPAFQSMAHLLGELHDRLSTVQLAANGRFPIPVAQDVLGEALGLSVVHTNRVLSQLRRQGVLQLGPGWAMVSDRSKLTDIVYAAAAMA